MSLIRIIGVLPGGIMGEGQTIDEAVNNVLHNLTGIHGIHQEQVGFYSAVDRHPVKRVVTVCFYALIKPEDHPAIPHDYVSDVQWFPLDNLPKKLGFDHAILAQDALAKLKTNLTEKLVFGELLPEFWPAIFLIHCAVIP